MKMELIDGSETSAIRTQTPGNYPKENILQEVLLYSVEKTVTEDREHILFPYTRSF